MMNVHSVIATGLNILSKNVTIAGGYWINTLGELEIMELCLHVVGKVEAEKQNDEAQYTIHCRVFLNGDDATAGGQVAAYVVDQETFDNVSRGQDLIFTLKE